MRRTDATARAAYALLWSPSCEFFRKIGSFLSKVVPEVQVSSNAIRITRDGVQFVVHSPMEIRVGMNDPMIPVNKKFGETATLCADRTPLL